MVCEKNADFMADPIRLVGVVWWAVVEWLVVLWDRVQESLQPTLHMSYTPADMAAGLRGAGGARVIVDAVLTSSHRRPAGAPRRLDHRRRHDLGQRQW